MKIDTKLSRTSKGISGMARLYALTLVSGLADLTLELETYSEEYGLNASERKWYVLLTDTLCSVSDTMKTG